MIQLEGSLSIRTIQGRHGPFNVGTLSTELGEFAVKDATLDQYEEGKYQGVFGVSRIHPSSYIAGGRVILEVRATLETMALEGIDQLDEGDPVAEPDPADEVSVPPKVPAIEREAEPLEAKIPADDETLFGDLWPLQQKVKLDPTVDRKLFRQQRDRLKELGYKFEAVGQTWQHQD